MFFGQLVGSKCKASQSRRAAIFLPLRMGRSNLCSHPFVQVLLPHVPQIRPAYKTASRNFRRPQAGQLKQVRLPHRGTRDDLDGQLSGLAVTTGQNDQAIGRTPGTRHHGNQLSRGVPR